MVSDAIKAAILAGEAELQAKKDAEAAKNARIEAENAAWRERQRAVADVWVTEVLPGKIRELTAKGERWLYVDNFQAAACRAIGMKVIDTWIEDQWDEGVNFGGYTSYKVTW